MSYEKLQPGVRMNRSKNLFELTDPKLYILMKLNNQKNNIQKTNRAFGFPNIDHYFRFY